MCSSAPTRDRHIWPRRSALRRSYSSAARTAQLNGVLGEIRSASCGTRFRARPVTGRTASGLIILACEDFPRRRSTRRPRDIWQCVDQPSRFNPLRSHDCSRSLVAPEHRSLAQGGAPRSPVGGGIAAHIATCTIEGRTGPGVASLAGCAVDAGGRRRVRRGDVPLVARRLRACSFPSPRSSRWP